MHLISHHVLHLGQLYELVSFNIQQNLTSLLIILGLKSKILQNKVKPFFYYFTQLAQAVR